MLASHGGFATLERRRRRQHRVRDDGRRLPGLRRQRGDAPTEGIQRAILEAIPEVTEVLDATDHDAGREPLLLITR